MRSKLMMFIVVGALVSAIALPAYADPAAQPEGKSWGYSLSTLADVNEVEPNDVCPGQGISCGDVVHAAISSGTDNDYFYFYVTSPVC